MKEKRSLSRISSNDLRWESSRNVALQHGLRACWSTPIFSFSGAVLGTFAIYFAEPRIPDSMHQGLVEIYAHLAGTAIERSRLEDSLEKHTSRFQRLVETANLIPWEAEYSTGRLTFIGPQVQQLLGYPEEHWYREHVWERCIHPDDSEWVTTYCRETATLETRL